jgi:hypothetical protein
LRSELQRVFQATSAHSQADGVSLWLHDYHGSDHMSESQDIVGLDENEYVISLRYINGHEEMTTYLRPLDLTALRLPPQSQIS